MWLDARERIHAPAIEGEWLNSPPLRPADLRGRVVLVDFWDYTCVNCLRTLPYLREWHRRYALPGSAPMLPAKAGSTGVLPADHSLVIIGVHAPEFHFARDRANVERALRAERIEYPVVLDNDYRTWQAFANRCWPAKYLIDALGYIRYIHLGEGAYAGTEEAIQRLLREAGAGALREAGALRKAGALREAGAGALREAGGGASPATRPSAVNAEESGASASGIRNLESGIFSPESGMPYIRLTANDMTASSNPSPTIEERTQAAEDRTQPADDPGARCLPGSHGSPCLRLTPELYLGYGRGRLGNESGYVENRVADYAPAARRIADVAYFEGPWFAGREQIVACPLLGRESRLRVAYTAAEVNLVLAPPDPADLPVEGRATLVVRQDSRPLPPENRGSDVIEIGSETVIDVTEPRMYRLVRNREPGTHELELWTRKPGLEAYAFTFVAGADEPRPREAGS